MRQGKVSLLEHPLWETLQYREQVVLFLPFCRLLISGIQRLRLRSPTSQSLCNVTEHIKCESLRHWSELIRPESYLAIVIFSKTSHLLFLLLFMD